MNEIQTNPTERKFSFQSSKVDLLYQLWGMAEQEKMTCLYGYQPTLNVIYSLDGLETPLQDLTLEKDKMQHHINSLLKGDEDGQKADAQAVRYAYYLVERLSSACFLLPPPAISATSENEVYFEWLTEGGGTLLLTVGPDGTIAYVCTFGKSRSRNLGTWEDGIIDLIAPCFTKLIQVNQANRISYGTTAR